jgi:protein-S-isoprenylcysteine O-methyltransferase Ste14
MPIDLILFLALSAGLLLWSWASRRISRTHGLYRFLALELLLALALLNRARWFTETGSLLQIVAWLCLLASLALAGLSFYPPKFAREAPAAGETAPAPARRGIYKYIRHPLYSALFFLGWAIFFKSLTPPNNSSFFLTALLLSGASLLLVSTARLEEANAYARLGDAYAAYLKTTKMFIPFIF